MYDSDTTLASLNSLGQLAVTLQEHHEDIVLVGGWAPYFITLGHFEHGGSQDIDLVLRKDVLRENEQSVNIREKFDTLGYQTATDAKFYKDLPPSRGRGLEAVRIDLLCDKEGEHCNSGDACYIADGIKAHAFDGMSIAFDCNSDQRIPFKLDEISQQTTFKVIDLVGSLALKGNSFATRPPFIEEAQQKKDKDAFDIFAVTHYNGGPREAAEYFNQAVSAKKISPQNLEFLKQSILIINRFFRDKGQDGPICVQNYQEDERDIRDMVVGQMRVFLDNIVLE